MDGSAGASQLSRVPGLIVIMRYCLCGVLQALPVTMWVSIVFSHLEELVTKLCVNKYVNFHTWCLAMD